MITASEITAVVRRLPEVATSPLTLTRGAVTAQDFVRWPFARLEKKGEPRPEAYFRERKISPAPMFDAAAA